jgi:uncharacterized protein (TIGR02452 family)
MKSLISRDMAERFGHEAVAIIRAGHYVSISDRRVEVADAVRHAVANTHAYPPNSPLPIITAHFENTHVEVTNETTLNAARRLITAGERPVALNFASAMHPGGGFLNGARAQEESLCWSSGLYACLEHQPMYDFHRQRHDPLYTDYTLYSSDVPVFRDDNGQLLDEPYLCPFITSAAVNANALLQRDPSRRKEIAPAMTARIHKVLTLGAAHGHTSIILGAWGCGAFGNDGHEIAALFDRALKADFRGVYDHVVFAVLDFSREQRFIRPFKAVFP